MAHGCPIVSHIVAYDSSFCPNNAIEPIFEPDPESHPDPFPDPDPEVPDPVPVPMYNRIQSRTKGIDITWEVFQSPTS